MCTASFACFGYLKGWKKSWVEKTLEEGQKVLFSHSAFFRLQTDNLWSSMRNHSKMFLLKSKTCLERNASFFFHLSLQPFPLQANATHWRSLFPSSVHHKSRVPLNFPVISSFWFWFQETQFAHTWANTIGIAISDLFSKHLRVYLQVVKWMKSKGKAGALSCAFFGMSR